MHAYLGGVSGRLDCTPVIVGGTEDHVHLLCRFARTITVADWVKELKRTSSQWAKTRGGDLVAFAWQAGYGAFTVSASNVEAVRSYFENQKEHHRVRTFQEEYRGFLRKHGIEWDERYVWD